MEYWHGELTLKELQLTNFRQFEALNIGFHEKLTVLIGENGSGKTTILEAVDKAMQLFTKRMERADSDLNPRDFFFVSDINNQKNGGQVDVDVVLKVDDGKIIERLELDENQKIERIAQIKDEIDFHFREASIKIEELNQAYSDNPIELDKAKSEVEKERDEKVEKLKHELEKLEPFSKQKIKEEADLQSQNSLNWNIQIERNIRKKGEFSDLQEIENFAQALDDARNKTNDISIPFFKYYPCRDLDNTPNHEKIYKNDQRNLVETESTSIETFTTWYRRVERRSAEKNDLRLLNEVQKAIYELLSGEKPHHFDNLRLSYLNEEKPDGELWIDKNGFPLRLEQLSSGETMLLLLVADLARRFVLANPGSVDPYKTGSAVILIDEVDLHLHPKWQIKVLGKLMDIFPKAQFLVTTHSPLILASLDREQIYWLEQGQIIDVPASKGRDYTSLLFEFMGVPMRPIEMQERLDKLYKMVEEDEIGEEKIGEIKQEITEIKKDVGENDPDIIKLENILIVLED